MISQVCKLMLFFGQLVHYSFVIFVCTYYYFCIIYDYFMARAIVNKYTYIHKPYCAMWGSLRSQIMIACQRVQFTITLYFINLIGPESTFTVRPATGWCSMYGIRIAGVVTGKALSPILNSKALVSEGSGCFVTLGQRIRSQLSFAIQERASSFQGRNCSGRGILEAS